MNRILLFVLASYSIFAQNAYGTWLKLNTPHRLIGDKVRVRAAADSKAEVIAELAIGSKITPVEQLGEVFTVDGVEAPWYRVQYTQSGKKLEGYVWGNLIAKAYAEGTDGKVFLFGTGRRQKTITEGTEFTSQVRVAQAGKEIARLEVKEGTGFQSYHNVALTGGRGLDGVESIFSVEFIQEYCGGKGNKMFFFWTGKKLLHAHSSIDGADAPYYATEKQVFPNEKGGKKGHVVLEQEHGDHDDPKSQKKERVVLKWNGKKLEKTQ